VAAEEAKADPVAWAPGRDAGPDRVDDADDLVAGHDRSAGLWTNTLTREEIAVAHPAGEDTRPHMAWLRVDDFALDQLELTLPRDLESAVRRHGDP
jgi:hypothetical protein